MIDAKPTEKAKTETKMSKLRRQKIYFFRNKHATFVPQGTKNKFNQKGKIASLDIESSSIHVSPERGVPGGWCNPLGESGGGVGRLGAFFDGY